VDKEDDSYVLRLGPIPRAAGAICAIDEIGRMRPEDQEQLLHALQEGKMPFVKHGFDLLLDGRATFIMSSNPKNPSGNWNDKEKINFNEIPLLGPLRDRVGLIFIFRTNRKMGYVADYAFKKTRIINTIEEVNAEEDKDYEYLRKYILYCKRFNPKLSKEAESMIAQYYVNIVTKPESQQSPRLLDTLTSLCYAVTRLKQKNTIDIDDVNDVIEFYNEQLLHLSELVSIPRDPRDLASEEIVAALKDSPFRYEFVELVKTAREKNVFVREFIGEDLHVRTNRKLREIRDRFLKLEDNRILIISYSPLTLAWKDSYKGGVVDNSPSQISEDKNNDGYGHSKIGQQDSTRKVFESDTSDTSDGDIKGNENGREKDKLPHRPELPFSTADKDKMSHVTHVTHVTSEQSGTDNPNQPNPASEVRENTTCIDAAEFLSSKEREKCKQTTLTDEQISIFCQMFKNLEAESNLNPGSFSSDDKGTVGGEELRLRIVSSSNCKADEADRIVTELHRVGVIKKVAFDTFKRAYE
jgi:hypothetical protein